MKVDKYLKSHKANEFYVKSVEVIISLWITMIKVWRLWRLQKKKLKR